MPNIAESKANLLHTIQSLEGMLHALNEKRNSLADTIDSLKAAASKIDELALDDMSFPNPPALNGTDRQGPKIIAVENVDHTPPFFRLAQSALRPGTQFNRIADFFVGNGNTSVTVAELA